MTYDFQSFFKGLVFSFLNTGIFILKLNKTIGGSNSESFYLWLHLKNKVANHCPEHYSRKESMLRTVIHYLKKEVGVVDFAKTQGFQSPRARKGPRALKFYQFAGFCKIYYSHFIFEVISFLSKIQNHSRNIVKLFQKFEGKTTNLKY